MTGRFIFSDGKLVKNTVHKSRLLSMQEYIIHNPLPTDPPEEIKIQAVKAEPYPDGRRVKVKFILSSFTQGPNALVTLTSNNIQLVSVNIVNIFVPENEITLHIPGDGVKPGTYQVELDLFFIVETENEAKEDSNIRLRESHLDSASVSFTIQ